MASATFRAAHSGAVVNGAVTGHAEAYTSTIASLEVDAVSEDIDGGLVCGQALTDSMLGHG